MTVDYFKITFNEMQWGMIRISDKNNKLNPTELTSVLK